MTPVWKNEDLEEAVIGALFLRGADPEVLDVLSRLPASTFSVRQYREIYTGICRQARGGGVIDPLLLCESLPALQTTILEATRVSWAKSALVSYVDVLRRNAGVRDAESALEKLEQIRSASNGDAALAALEAAKLAVSAIDISADTVQPVHISELLTAVADEAESRSQGKETRSLLTGIEELDAKTGGIEPQIWCLSPRVHRWAKPSWPWILSTKYPLRAWRAVFQHGDVRYPDRQTHGIRRWRHVDVPPESRG
jgi:replicative DNA helicase